jgi:biopolymer transport protein ExbD
MTKNQIKKALEDALFKDGNMEADLYEYELEEMQEDLKASLQEDNDDYIFALTVHTNDVTQKQDTALVLIEKSGEVYINEAAREKLKAIWERGYAANLRSVLADFIQQLHNGEIPINGIKTVLDA